MKLNVEIYQDKEFLKQAEGLILSRINEILRNETDFRKLVETIVDKYIKRNVIKTMVDQKISEIVKHTEFREPSRYSHATYYISEYIQEKTNKIIHNIVNEKLSSYVIDIKREE